MALPIIAAAGIAITGLVGIAVASKREAERTREECIANMSAIGEREYRYRNARVINPTTEEEPRKHAAIQHANEISNVINMNDYL